MSDLVAAVSAVLIIGMVTARLTYLAGYRAGERMASEATAEKCFEEGYRVGWRTRAVLGGLPHRRSGAGPFVHVFGCDPAASSPVDEAERITQEASDGD